MKLPKFRSQIPFKKGIAREWFFKYYIFLVAIAVLIMAIICVSVSSYHRTSVISRADEYAQEFSLLSTYKSSEFESKAQEYAENFAFKDKMEVQILNKSGNVIVSTTGFDTVIKPPKDFKLAKSNSNKTGIFEGKSDSGERILAKTYILNDIGNGSNGAVRYIVSMSNAHRRTAFVCAFVVLIGIIVLVFTVIMGTFFMKSIVSPITAVGDMTRRISLGDFATRIDIKRDDEIGELCDSINNMAAELQNAENMKNEFISSVSHELRTPLTAIRGWGETAKMSLDTDPELVGKGLDIVLRESSRLSDLVEDLLDFSRMQSQSFKIDARPILISEILNEAVQMYLELARQHSIDLTYLPPSEESTVMADANRIKQVFINIIDNAIKYTEGAGQVLITQYEEEGCVTVKVSDTGTGIPEAAIDRVKEKFFRYNKTTSGSGIGLAVADEILKQHNGLLFLESTEGVGTCVTVVLPVCEQPEETVDEISLAPTGAEKPKENKDLGETDE